MNQKNKKIVLLGALPTEDPRSWGGVTISFKMMLDFFKESQTDVEYIDLYRKDSNLIVHTLSVIISGIRSVYKNDIIIFNAQTKDVYIICPILVFFSKIFNKKFILRKFTGDFDEIYLKAGFFKKRLISYTLKNTTQNFFETHHLVKFFKDHGFKSDYLPNIRDLDRNIQHQNKTYSNKILYIGRITEVKGIDLVLEAAKKLPSHQFDFYGYIEDPKYNKILNEIDNVTFYGVIPHKELHKKLLEYQVFLMPSYHSSEGYPGVLFDCMLASVLVMVSNWRALPEIIQHDKNGILVEPYNVEDIVNKIKNLNTDKINKLTYQAFKDVFDRYDANKVHSKLLRTLLD